jgi:aminoglycoside phosphotransferase family enzyme/predicted kinase
MKTYPCRSGPDTLMLPDRGPALVAGGTTGRCPVSSISCPDAKTDDSAFVVTHQTHAAVVFLVGEYAYKLKKPVNLGFLDFSTRDKRLAVCRREVDLNRRMAPDVYLGVADVHGPDGAVWDHLVVMRRMPAQRRLSRLVRAGEPVEDHLRRLARLLAAFHARADRGPQISAEGTAEAIRRRWTDSFGQVRAFRGTVLDDGLAGEVEARTLRFLAGRAPLFDDRIAAARVVDGHGDLLADDIFCLDAGPRALDCIEFDDRLRWLDGLDDAAFLAMDLEYLGAARLGGLFLDWYAEFAADPAPPSLRHHFLAYRAFVRAKVACLRHAQGEESAAGEAARYTALAAEHLRAGEVALVLVGGLPATGKSTLGGHLADRLGAVLLSSDRLRKELAGLAPGRPASAGYEQGIYQPARTERTYSELLGRAERLLQRGESVVLDASWLRAAHRAVAREVAGRTHSTLVELRCDAPAEVVAARLRGPRDGVSDADVAIAAAMAAHADPWPEAVTIRTDTALAESVATAAALIRPAQSATPVNGARSAAPVDGARPAAPVDGARPAAPVDGARPAAPAGSA